MRTHASSRGPGKRAAPKRPPPVDVDGPAKRRKVKRGAPRPNIALPAGLEADDDAAHSDDEDGDVAVDQAAAFVDGLNAEQIAQCVILRYARR